MAQVRAELGPEAVILSNQQRDGQVEIVCAVDYDENRLEAVIEPSTTPDQSTVVDRPADRFADAGMAQSRAVGNSLIGDSRSIADAGQHQAAGIVESGGQRVVWATDPLMGEMHSTVESLRDLIEHQMLDMVWSGAASHQPNTSLAVRKLLEAGFSADISRTLLSDIPAGYSRERALELTLAILKRKLPTPPSSLLEKGGRVAITGPSGVGKTTFAVGMAAKFARRHGVAEVALVGLDNQRVGAQEQLRMYGQLLGMQVHIVQEAGALKSTLQSLQKKALVVVDTAGFGGDDPALQNQLRQLMGLAAEDLQTLLILPAYASSVFLQAAVRRYRISIPQRCAITHLDSVTQPGVALSCLLENQLQAEFVSHGPRIADDLHRFDVGKMLARFKPTTAPLELLREKESANAG